jgi:hypothetical protein
MARHFAYYMANENPAGQGCLISPSDRSWAENESLTLGLTATGDVDIWTRIIIIFIYGPPILKKFPRESDVREFMMGLA